MKLVLLGRPGSGKTMFVHTLREQGYAVTHLDDYPILCQMYQQEGESTGRFRATSQDGFDVHDHAVYDEALWALEQQARDYDGHPLLIVEFARDDYDHALAQFSQDFLTDAVVLYIEAELETCIKRVRARLADSTGHPSCSEQRRREYYGRQLLCSTLPVTMLDNNGTQEAFREQVRQFAYAYLNVLPVLP